nr:hypothetical protein [uncultured Bacteroides sp.]
MKNSKLMFMFCCCIFAIISCNKKQNISIDNNLILLISKDVGPSLFIGVPFYCQGEGGKVIQIESRDLRILYNEGAFNLDYLSFLRKVLNQQIKLQSNRSVYTFKIDKDVDKEYQSKNLADFMHLYCKSSGTGEYILKKGFTENQRNSIFYFLFINNYLSVLDDYSGSFNIFSVSKYSRYHAVDK